MKELVRIEESVIGTEKRKTVNARDLWKALGSKRQFGNWIEDRLSEFIEEQDFTVNNFVNGRDANGRFTAKDYLLTLDVAKHLAMLERNDQGRRIRQYFIEIEKAYREESRKEYADIALLLETIRRQERELFAAELELKEWRKLAPSCEPGEISKITGMPRNFLRRVSATSKPTKHSYHRLKMALEEAENILPGFCEALASGRIRAASVPVIEFKQ
jgi:anti-repressor protein